MSNFIKLRVLYADMFTKLVTHLINSKPLPSFFTVENVKLDRGRISKISLVQLPAIVLGSLHINEKTLNK